MKARTDFAACLAISAVPLIAASLGLYRLISVQTAGVDMTPLAGACRIAYQQSMDATGHVGLVAFSALLLFLFVRSVSALWRGWQDTRRISCLKPWTGESLGWSKIEEFARTHLSERRIRVVEADEPMALTVGYWTPQVILSSGLLAALDEAELEAVFHHEMAHVARRDPLRTLIADCCRTGLPFIPVVSYLVDRFRTRKELEADAAAIESMGSPLPLASALAKILTTMPTPPPFGVGLSPTEARIDALLGRPVRESRAKLAGVIATSIPALAALSVGLYIIASSPHITALHVCPS
ncbi:MAG TPA: M56 family metallopeptidase [Dehalococcoidia bacterium]|nr:M56 family metallopeptidase [Dehalococcoidia bacterium]